MKLPVIYVFTHDSVAVGEDGPTHQPVEHLASLRAIPDLTVIRPADATETAAGWRQAFKINNGPVALLLSRQKFPVLNRNLEYGLKKGAYVLSDWEAHPTLFSSVRDRKSILSWPPKNVSHRKEFPRGSSVCRVGSFLKRLQRRIKIVCGYRRVSVRLAVEAGSPMGWGRYVGDGVVPSHHRFGASAPGGTTMEKFGFTVDNVVQRALELSKQYPRVNPPNVEKVEGAVNPRRKG